MNFNLTHNLCANVICYNLKAQPRGRSELSRKSKYNAREPNVRDPGETIAMAGKLKIHVDQDKCQGHARCKALAPELFELDEFGNAHEIGDGTVPKGLEDKAWLRPTYCPGN